MDKRVFIYHVTELDDDNFPYGIYFFDEGDKNLYVSPIEQEKWAAHEKKTVGHVSLLAALLIGVEAFFGTRMGTAISNNSAFENVLLLLGIVAAMFLLFLWIKKRDSKLRNKLTKEAGIRQFECDKTEEENFLNGTARYCRFLIAVWFSSSIIACILGYVIIAYVSEISAIYALLLILAFVLPVAGFCALSPNLKMLPAALSAIKKRLTVLKAVPSNE